MNKSVFKADDRSGLPFQVCMGANLTCMNDLMNRMGQFDHVDYNGIQVRMRVVLVGDIAWNSKPVYYLLIRACEGFDALQFVD